MMKKNLGTIGVLLGGTSSEREISLRSGHAVYDALVEGGYDAVKFDVTSEDRESLVQALNDNSIDVVFIALHGKFGEDGTVQAILEQVGLPFTGSGSESSRAAFDKSMTQAALSGRKIPVAPFVIIRSGEKYDYDGLSEHLGSGDMVIKPPCEGSSIGITIVRSAEEFGPAVDKAFHFGPKALIEKYIPGRELTVGILGEHALPVIEIRPKAQFFDYDAKYESGDTDYTVPADIEKELALLLQETALRAHNTLGCSGFSRVDFIVDKNGQPVVLELNTIPGFTSTSLVPKAARCAGIEFLDLCVQLIEFAYAKKKIKNQSASLS